MKLGGMLRKKIRAILKRLMKRGVIKRANNPQSLNMNKEKADEILRNVYLPEKIKWDNNLIDIDTNKYDLSVIIPVYNAQKYLKQCIDSVLNQKTDYKYEIICIDDGSIDDSPKILEAYLEYDNMRVISQTNHGIAFARNRGIENANGKYILLVDNDDYLAENFIQKLLKDALHYDADIVKCGYSMFNEKKGVISQIQESPKRIISGNLQSELLTYNGFVWGTVIRRSLFSKVSFPNGYWYEDMITRLLIYRLSHKFIYEPELLYYYRVHNQNASRIVWNTKNYKALDQFYLAEEIGKQADKLGLLFDYWTFCVYLDEFGKLLYTRTKNLECIVRKAVFFQAAELIDCWSKKIKLQDLSFENNMLLRSFWEKDFILWERVCKLLK